MYHKEIIFDRATRDYAMYLDGELVGFARTYHEAEVTLEQLVCELLGELPVAEAPTDVAEVHARPADVAEFIAGSAPTADAPPVATFATPVPAATFAASPVTDQAVAAVLETLAEREAQAARHARTRARCPELTEEQREEVKAEATFFQRGANSYTKALLYWNAGIRPVRTEAGNYVLPSQRAGEPPHLLTMQGDWVCTCLAGATAHWAKAMIIGLEAAHDALEAETVGESWNGYTDPATGYDADDYAEESEAPALGQRLAWARAEIEINELFT